MPRHPRQVSPTGVYHFINRGVNKKILFHRPEDFDYYLKLILEYKERLNIQIYHYCFMSNHTHMLLQAADTSPLSQFAHFIQRRYAYYYCKTYHWSEQVFRKRFIALPIEKDAYLLECGRYIERNPLDAHLVENLINYYYSSYNFYAYNKPDPLVTESPLYSTLGRSQDERMNIYRFYVDHNRNYAIPKSITGELVAF